MHSYERHSPELTSQLILEISALVRVGNYPDTAAAFHGIPSETFHRWMREGAQEGASIPLIELLRAVERAEAESEMRDLEVIVRAAQRGSWEAASWILERRQPKRWAKMLRGASNLK